MLLFKDYATQKKSLTVTLTLVSVLITWASIGLNMYLLATGQTPDSSLIYATMTMTAPMLGLYWNKRVRVGKDGLTLDRQDRE